MDRKNIDKIAKTPQDKLLLSKLWDKIQAGLRKNIPVSTCFLSPYELEMSRFLFGQLDGLHTFGGYPEAERRMLVYLPEYLNEGSLDAEAGLVCLRASFYENDSPSHRDFLGALMGLGIARETIGDILVGNESCDFFVTTEVAPFLLQNFTSAGRVKLHLEEISLNELSVAAPQTKEIRDTLASLRLDSVISSGFRIGRSQAADYVTSGRAAINGLPCEKPDKAVSEGMKISVRGLGKILLRTVGGQTKKGRISVVIDRYI